MIAGLYAVLARPVIKVDQDGDIPEYPYVTYSITSPYIDQYGHEIERWFEEGGGLSVELTKHIEMVLSFSAYSEDEDEANLLCMRIIEYFTRTGRLSLQDIGIVVVGASNAQNRSVLLVEHYERRWGVDVRIRVVDSSTMAIEYINEAPITEGG